MSTRKAQFSTEEIYHIYNRGVDKRTIFKSRSDVTRFIESIDFVNHEKVGVKFIHRSRKSADDVRVSKPLVEIIAVALLNNHYHFLMKPLSENGISKFMQRLGTSHTKYFNTKHNRTGPLFSGKFKSVHINTDSYFQLLLAYINYNDLVHGLDRKKSLFYSSRDELETNTSVLIARKNWTLAFSGVNIRQFKNMAVGYVKEVRRRRDLDDKEIINLLLED